MSNHPNMSYCMWENTYQDLRQVADDFEERLHASPNFPDAMPERLSADELRAMRNAFDLMHELLIAAGVDEDCFDPGQAAVDAITPEADEPA